MVNNINKKASNLKSKSGKNLIYCAKVTFTVDGSTYFVTTYDDSIATLT